MRSVAHGRVAFSVAGGILLACGLMTPAHAQSADYTSGTLAKVRATGTIELGVRQSAKPFSYRLPDGTPAGYAVDLCYGILRKISAGLRGRPLTTTWHTVTPETRIPMVVAGDVDLECGSTTKTEQRQKLVAFSPVFFIAGTKLLVPAGSAVQSYRDLGGRTVAVLSGTTNEAAMHTLADRLLIRMTFVAVPDHAQAMTVLRSGSADALANDDVLLAGLAASPEGSGYMVVGDYLSYEPYGLMFRKDDSGFAALIESSFREMAARRELAALYQKWLVDRLPSGEVLNIPMSAELTQAFRLLGQPD